MVTFDSSDLARIYSALILPCNADESINWDSLRQLVDRQIADGVEGFYCCGSSGEGLLMTLEERKRFVEAVVNQAAGRVPVIAHIGTIRTSDVIELAKHAKEAGCVAISMIPPYYYKFSQNEIAGYYEDVIRAVPDMPVILYNIPQFTGIEFNKANASRLLDNPNIIGIKHTSNNLYSLERMAAAYPQKLLINGFDEQFLGALSMGAAATVSTTANLFAPLFTAIRDAYQLGEMAKAKEYQQALNMRVELLCSVGIFPGTKYACTLKGIDCGIDRPRLCGQHKKRPCVRLLSFKRSGAASAAPLLFLSGCAHG